jgi:D-cysteine desulfhydrase
VTADPLWPLFDDFPELASLPRVALRGSPTPVERAGERLWIKRDDLTATPVGGNKVRALEFLLGPFDQGKPVFTAGSRGSTHVLATTVHAKRLGISVIAASWPQEMNDVARAVDARLERDADRRHFRSPVSAALWLTWRAWRGDQVIPAGGTSPLGIIGHVNAAYELTAQVRAGLLPPPSRVVIPLGTGGTAAGLALGFRLAGLDARVVCARVVPRIVGRASRVRRLARSTIELIRRESRTSRAFPEGVDVDMAASVYGGAYGRPLAGAPDTTSTGVPLDPTYSAKAYVAAVESARDLDTLFWHTFDSRWSTRGERA